MPHTYQTLPATQLVTLGILCVKESVSGVDPKWMSWADDWLSGKDRTVKSALKALRVATPYWPELHDISIAAELHAMKITAMYKGKPVFTDEEHRRREILRRVRTAIRYYEVCNVGSPLPSVVSCGGA